MQAILRQWEREQLGGDVPAPRSYWVSNVTHYGHHEGLDMHRPCPVGCLKHVSINILHVCARFGRLVDIA